MFHVDFTFILYNIYIYIYTHVYTTTLALVNTAWVPGNDWSLGPQKCTDRMTVKNDRPLWI